MATKTNKEALKSSIARWLTSSCLENIDAVGKWGKYLIQ